MRSQILAPCLCLFLAAGPHVAHADDFADQILAAHNQTRAELKLEPLRWDPVLAIHAKSWAIYLSRLGKLQHDRASGEGENLWMGEAAAFTPQEMVGDWVGEKSDFHFGVMPAVSNGGDWTKVGHFTQVVWRATSHVGCAKVTANDWDYLVCRYRIPGNIIGEKPY